MKNWKVDVPVYLIFFNRPDTFSQVFEAVRQAKPSKLFLACDGARIGRDDDKINIEKCKEIVSKIDWECEVYRNYSEENLGCGKRMVTGIDWAFEYVDRLIVLEDDCVPSDDFFYFCEELLEKYKNDDRIFMINAMNHLGKYEKTGTSYFFGPGCCWGWATWKRAWKNMDFEMSFLQDEHSMRNIEKNHPYYSNAYSEGLLKLESFKRGMKQTTWTYQAGMASALNSQMAIVPSYNMITNIGLTADSGHAVNNLKKLPRNIQKYFNQPSIKMEFPLKHPKYIIEDLIYYEEVNNLFKVTPFTRIEAIVRRLFYAEKGEIKKELMKILKK